MPTVRHLKLLYGVAYLFWLAFYAIKLFFLPPPDHNPNLSAAVYCFLLVAAVPALGYLLLFNVFPWIVRSLRRA